MYNKTRKTKQTWCYTAQMYQRQTAIRLVAYITLCNKLQGAVYVGKAVGWDKNVMFHVNWIWTEHLVMVVWKE